LTYLHHRLQHQYIAQIIRLAISLSDMQRPFKRYFNTTHNPNKHHLQRTIKGLKEPRKTSMERQPWIGRGFFSVTSNQSQSIPNSSRHIKTLTLLVFLFYQFYSWKISYKLSSVNIIFILVQISVRADDKEATFQQNPSDYCEIFL
jgi:hypothetical protein